MVVPLAVVIRIAFADWISAVIIAATLPLIPLFGILIGWHTRAQTQRQWRLLALLSTASGTVAASTSCGRYLAK